MDAAFSNNSSLRDATGAAWGLELSLPVAILLVLLPAVIFVWWAAMAPKPSEDGGDGRDLSEPDHDGCSPPKDPPVEDEADRAFDCLSPDARLGEALARERKKPRPAPRQ